MRQEFEQVSEQRRTFYRCLDLEIDPIVPSLTRSGQPVELRAKALTLLLFLFDQRHRIVSKEEIFERVWPNTAVMDATLAGCIQEVRRALGDDAKDPRFIRTVPRLGYRFVAPVDEPVSPVLTLIVPPINLPPPVAPRRRALIGFLAFLSLAAAAVWLRRPAPPDDLAEVAWWKFDEGRGQSVADSSGHGLTGTIADATWDSGVRGGALRFAGTGQRVSGLDAAHVLPRLNTPRTLAAWVRAEHPNGDIAGILHFGDTRGPTSFDAPQLMLLPDGRPAFANQGYAGIGNDRSLAVAPQGILDGRWHHLAGTLAEGRGILYLDGIPAAVTAMRPVPPASSSWFRSWVPSQLPWTPATPWAIASHFDQSRSGFHGSLDDVRIWRRALRPAEVAALHRCTAGLSDVTTPRGQYFFSPIFPWDARPMPRLSLRDGHLQHDGDDYAGIQLAAQSQDCPVENLRGADLGQDLRLAVDLLVPFSASGDVLQAGPYFRSRAAAPGDGILGGTSAGYWVQLHSSGRVSVKCLNPVHTVAYTAIPASHDPHTFHRLEVVARGETLEVSLDRQLLQFYQGERLASGVQIPPHWERPVAIGRNQGAVGLAFSSEPLRPKAGGQQARSFTVAPAGSTP